MTPRPLAACLALALVFALPASAHGQDGRDPPREPPAAFAAATKEAEAIVDAFGAALKAGDMDKVRALLADDVLILESGGAEHSKEEYFASHAAADAEFLRDAHFEITRRTTRVTAPANVVWVGTESELHASKDGQPLTLLASETMVLELRPEGWRIAHIHWSSRPKP